MKITELFTPRNAKSRNLESYLAGDTPFVSNATINNGIVRYVEANLEGELIKNVPCIAVNGFGCATVQTEAFIGAGNGGVHIIALLPKKKMEVIELAYYAAQINASSWRFSYGRRAILRRLLKIALLQFNLSEEEMAIFKGELFNINKKAIDTVLIA